MTIDSRSLNDLVANELSNEIGCVCKVLVGGSEIYADC